jgi:bis(5'-nucleosyl)-tetraphosphatase (symmetrical)
MLWLVGDIHGCARELDRLLAEIRFDPGEDELWSVGDLVNSGPESASALRLWKDAGGRGVLGNHDLYALQAYAGIRERERDTLDSLFRASDVSELIATLDALPLMVHLPGGDGLREVWIVHAGLPPGCGDLHDLALRLNSRPRDASWSKSAAVAFATRARCCSSTGEMVDIPVPPESCPEGSMPWDHFYRGDALLVHGHWAHRGFYRNEWTMGLDSGCVYGGKLTAWCRDEDRVVQV